MSRHRRKRQAKQRKSKWNQLVRQFGQARALEIVAEELIKARSETAMRKRFAEARKMMVTMKVRVAAPTKPTSTLGVRR